MQRERAAEESLDHPGVAADTFINTWSLAVLDSWMQLFRWWQDQYLSVLGIWAAPFQAMQASVTRGLGSPYFREAPAITAQDTGLAGGAAQQSTAGNLPGMRENLVRGTDDSQLHFGVDNPIFIEYLRSMAEQCFAVGNHSLALLYLRVAEEREDRLISQMFSFVSEGKRLEYLQAFQDHLSEVLSWVIQLHTDTEAVRFGLDLVLRRKGLAAEAFAVQRDAVFAGNHPELAPAFQRRYELQQQIARLRLDGPVTESLDVFRQRLTELSAELNRLDEEIVREMPSLNRAIEHVLRAADCRSVAGCLPEGSALIEFAHVVQSTPAQGADVLSERYVAFVLCAGDPEHVQLFDLGDARVIDQQILAFRTAITGETEERGRFTFADDRDAYRAPSDQSLMQDQGKALYDLVFAPLVPALRGRRRLLIAPDGKLNLVPFEALFSSKKHCLIDDYEMSYLGVGRDLLRFGARPSDEPTEPLVLAAPNFDLHSEGEVRTENPSLPGLQSRDLSQAIVNFPPLPGTYEEGQRVAALLSVEPCMGDSAVEARLKATRSPRILHLATHGYFLPGQVEEQDALSTPQDKGGSGAARLIGAGAENPLLRSGLALAGANTRLRGKPLPVEAEDGILNAVDVSGLDLLNTELVVLSACQTGLGDVRPGEGVFGLRRAFAQAGAKTLVISLWKVPDLATTILMEQFYSKLRNGLPRDKALREAQQYVRQVTVGELKSGWLAPEAIARVAAGKAQVHQGLERLAHYADNHCPFSAPRYWAAFICQGDPAPLAVLSHVASA